MVTRLGPSLTTTLGHPEVLRGHAGCIVIRIVVIRIVTVVHTGLENLTDPTRL